jgi:hypothetical protein
MQDTESVQVQRRPSPYDIHGASLAVHVSINHRQIFCNEATFNHDDVSVAYTANQTRRQITSCALRLTLDKTGIRQPRHNLVTELKRNHGQELTPLEETPRPDIHADLVFCLCCSCAPFVVVAHHLIRSTFCVDMEDLGTLCPSAGFSCTSYANSCACCCFWVCNHCVRNGMMRFAAANTFTGHVAVNYAAPDRTSRGIRNAESRPGTKTSDARRYTCRAT